MTETIVITGGAGFIGYHLIDRILTDIYKGDLSRDTKVICLDRNVICERIGYLKEKWANFDQHVILKKIDIEQQIPDFMLDDVNVIFHLAAETHIPNSVKDPIACFQSNIMGTANMLEYARKCKKLRRFINVSTSEVYGSVPIGETWDRNQVNNPYAASKAGAEQIGISYYHSFRVPVVTVNYMNIIGEFQEPNRFLPMCVNKILNGETINIHISPITKKSRVRKYLYVKNLVNCFMKYEMMAPGCQYHFEGQMELSNVEFASMVADSLSMNLLSQFEEYQELSSDLLPMSRQYRNLSGVLYHTPFQVGFSNAVAWYKDYYNNRAR